VTKHTGEKLCKIYTELFGLKTVTFRYFNVYGPREPLKGPYAPVVGLFLRQKRAGEPLTIVGDGFQRRDFTHVKDVVDANILAMSYEGNNLLFNVGTGCNHSVLELARMISDTIRFIPPRQGEARETLANIENIKFAFDWHPSKKIEDYIQEQLNTK
jgi:UDP-glucose 4-epimerase